MKSIKVFSLALLLLATAPLFAQMRVVRGIVVDEEQTAIPQVTVSLRNIEDSILVRGTATDDKGLFILEHNQKGRYVLQFSHINYVLFEREVIIADEDLTLNNTVLAVSSGINLKDIDVTVRQPLISRSIDKVTLNIEGSVYERGENALRLFNVIPGVNVIGRNITFRGSETVTVYIDNRRLILPSDQLATYLSNIPSESIKSYDLKAVPGAENDGQSTGVIVNITLKSEYKFGLTGNLNAGYWYNEHSNSNGSATFNYRVDKVTLQVGTNYRNAPAFYVEDVAQNFEETGIRGTQQENYLEKFHTYGINVGIDYRLTDNQTLGTNYDLFKNPGDFKNTTTMETAFLSSNPTNRIDSTQISNKQDRFQYTSQMANLFYRNKLDSLGSKLDVGYSFVRYSLRNPSTIETLFENNVSSEANAPDSLYTFNDGSSDAHVFNIDLEKYFSKSMVINMGGKYTLSKTKYLMEYRDGLTSDSPLDPVLSNDFLYAEDILAFYGAASKSFKSWQIKLGLRAEQTDYTGNSSNGENRIERKRWDWFPSAFLNRKIGENHSLTMSYARRIIRPGFRELNPFIFYTSAVNIQEGNPYLLPYYGDNVQLEYLMNGKYSFTFGHQKTNNGIATNIVNRGDVIISRVENIIDENNFYFSIYIPFKLANWWVLNVNSTIRSTSLNVRTNPEVHRSKLSQFASASSKFNLPNGYLFEISGFYSGNNFDGFFDAHDVGKLDLFVKKSFFNDRLAMSLEIYDPFHLYKPGRNINTATLSRDISRTKIDFSRYIGVWLSYNFSVGKKSSNRENIERGGNDVKQRL